MNASSLLTWLSSTLLPLGALWLVYRLALRRERCFGYNRALLLLAPLVAAVLPLLPLPALPAWLVSSGAPSAALPPLPGLLLPTVAPVAAGGGFGWGWLAWVYAGGVGLLLGRLAYQGWRLHRATRHLPREKRAGYVLARTGGRLPTSSFGRTIFWDDTAGLTPAEAAPVLAHELAHVRQGHSYDVLWLEVWRAMLWPNPFAHLLLPALRLTHELLADQAAAQSPTPLAPAEAATPYPALLARLALRGVAGSGYAALLQPFIFSFTLTRIAMLQNQIPVRRWKQWLILPVLGGLFLAACRTTNADVVKPVVDKEARKAMLIANFKEAIRQDSLHNGGKGWKDETRMIQVDKDGNVTIIHRGDAPTLPRLTTTPQSAAGGADADKVYTYVDQMPRLPTANGMGAIVQQIRDNFVHPGGPQQEGRVFASFTVQADGSVTDTKIVKGLSAAYDDAVLAAIQKLPRFVPGMQSGKAVAVSFTVPITFKEKP
ncbi:hypothetical protein A0257_10040 [Hymenobacter psoromatis]|nr:hypothetical protein A0257_10040 [Hymenobacter psoromatis]